MPWRHWPTRINEPGTGTPEILSLEEGGITVYPNPGRKGADNELVLVLSSPSKQVLVKIIDGWGKLVVKGW